MQHFHQHQLTKICYNSINLKRNNFSSRLHRRQPIDSEQTWHQSRSHPRSPTDSQLHSKSHPVAENAESPEDARYPDQAEEFRDGDAMKLHYTFKDESRSLWSQMPQGLEPAERSEVAEIMAPREFEGGVGGVTVAFRRV
ncbi:uncharacterized protein RCC_06210 [Ramularia collo-cygni]|uniref:Uncharacterized protein n=1 Tax=Ramularia collo-cygni TaxID=112498 RepID=A0A2D3UUS3_9PEZI|nr:uncharacterized protein RCC_06210 [Ramularia collo-cygni]CZT20351.1 uncharacterized protein RCC_06210 [Ramularia collo-cygni]